MIMVCALFVYVVCWLSLCVVRCVFVVDCVCVLLHLVTRVVCSAMVLHVCVTVVN